MEKEKLLLGIQIEQLKTNLEYFDRQKDFKYIKECLENLLKIYEETYRRL